MIFLENLLHWILMLFYTLVGNYGLSLVFLSLTVTIIMIPLFYIAEILQKKDRELKILMHPALSKLKDVTNSRERYFYTRRIYSQYGYHPASSLKGLFGLLIQIPFFIAAYRMLGGFEGFLGIGFGPIPDLSVADAMLDGINILPFLMTAINLISGYLYSRDLERSERIQLVVVALLFLILLYDKPAALVLYWTMNNVFSIGKNMLMKRITPQIITVKAKEPEKIKLLREVIDSGWTLAFLAIFAVQLYWINNHYLTYKYPLLLTGLVASLATLVFLVSYFHVKSRLYKKNDALMSLVLLWIPAGGLILVWMLHSMHKISGISHHFTKVLITLFFDLIIARIIQVLFTYKEHGFPASIEKQKYGIRVSISSYLFLLAYILVFTPIALYVSTSGSLPISLNQLILNNLLFFVALSAIGIGIQVFVSKKFNLISSKGFIFLILAAFVYTYAFPGDYGLLNGHILSDGIRLEELGVRYYIFDIFLLFIIWKISGQTISRFLRPSYLFTILLFITFSLYSFYLYLESPNKTIGNPHTSASGIELVEPKISLSKDHVNVIVLIPDMFNSSYFPEFLRENTGAADRLEGFIYYPNTLSISTNTATSMPAILGGLDFTPRLMNEMSGTGEDKLNTALDKLVSGLDNSGYESFFINLPYSKERTDLAKVDTGTILDHYSYKVDPELFETGGIDYRRLLPIIASYQSMPNLMKVRAYGGGDWIIFGKGTGFEDVRRDSMRNWSLINLLPTMSVAASETPTFTFLHSMLTHYPYGIRSDGSFIEDDYPDTEFMTLNKGKSAFYSYNKFMDGLMNWTDWMKENDVYDNTVLIIVSDHGNGHVGEELERPDGFDERFSAELFSASNPVFLVKDLSSRGTLEYDNRFLSNGDASTIVARVAGIDGYSQDPTVGEQQDRILEYVRSSEYNNFLKKEQIPLTVYEVHGSIMDTGNWSLLQKE